MRKLPWTAYLPPGENELQAMVHQKVHHLVGRCFVSSLKRRYEDITLLRTPMSCFRNASFEYRFAARHSALAVLIVDFLCCFAKKVKIGLVYVYLQAALNAGTYDPPLRIFSRCYPNPLKIESTVAGLLLTTAKTHPSGRSH